MPRYLRELLCRDDYRVCRELRFACSMLRLQGWSGVGDTLSVAVGGMCTGGDLQLALLDISLELVEAGGAGLGLPGWDAAVEDVVHLLEGLALGLGSGEEHLSKHQQIFLF